MLCFNSCQQQCQQQTAAATNKTWTGCQFVTSLESVCLHKFVYWSGCSSVASLTRCVNVVLLRFLICQLRVLVMERGWKLILLVSVRPKCFSSRTVKIGWRGWRAFLFPCYTAVPVHKTFLVMKKINLSLCLADGGKRGTEKSSW